MFSGTLVSEATPCVSEACRISQQLRLDRCFKCVEIVDLFARDAATHSFENVHRRRHADVSRNQSFFEFVQQLLINLFAPGENRVESCRKATRAWPQQRAEIAPRIPVRARLPALAVLRSKDRDRVPRFANGRVGAGPASPPVERRSLGSCGVFRGAVATVDCFGVRSRFKRARSCR